MLKIRGLTKTYQGKDGNDVHALRGIDLSFPSKGMVFVLGKSGSGKSTLLNLLGGLDSPTSGTIEIDGNEIATFSRRDLDSYRNQYVGFVFQEYNVLDDFTVFDNVALALRLQNQEGNQEIVAKTLELVGLSGMEKRKANTLSGGQKQRVAIARAIVKNPEIVLADEPTGALDSTTGAEVLDVLKKLSKDKLVVVVSHDREYALRYGDRIIEIADGEIIHDTDTEGNKCPSNIAAGTDGSLCIADCESLSEEDIGAIVETLKKHRGKAALSFGDSAVPFFIAPSAESEEKKTAEPVDFSENKEKIAAKPNRLPLGTAIKMGATSLKKKPIRAALVCLLISLALGVFGIASSLMLYDTAFSIAATARNKNLDTSNVRKKYECTTVNHVYSAATGALIDQASYNPNPTSSTSMSAYFSVSEVEKLNARPSGLRFAGVYGVNLGSSDGALYFKDYKGNRTQYGKGFFGITDCGKDFMEQSGFTLVAGDYPTDANQIAISRFTFDCYKGTRRTPATAKDFVGKNIPFQVNDGTNRTITLTISGIYNTGDLPARYEAALDGFGDSKTNQELREYLYASFHRLAYVSPSFYETHGFAAKSLNHYMNYVNLACSNLIYGYDNASTPETTRTTYSFSPAEYVEKAGIPLSYEDEAGNPIEYVRPGDGECYLPISFPTNRDQEAAREYATRSLYALAHYESSPFLKELLPDETAINEAKEAAARVNQ